METVVKETVVKETPALNIDPFAEVVSASDATIDALKAAEEALKAVKAAHPAPSKPALSSIQFMGTISHELRTPLASILGYTQILYDELGTVLATHHKEFFQTILTNIELSLELVTDLLDYARLDAGQLAIQLSPVALQTLITQVIDQLYPFAIGKDITLSADLHEDTCYIAADEVRLRQVLINLILNAIKYTEEGSITVRVVSSMIEEQPAYTIEITDTGRGITDEFQASMFERYSRDERMAKLIEQGAGIGLAISLEFIRAMNGVIEVDSSIEVGTTFRLTFEQALLDYFNDSESFDEIPELVEEDPFVE
ncbi:MAG: sensor histidine kinase [Rhodothermales bacterium]